MPTNVTAEYAVAEMEYVKATTKEQKLKALKKMLSAVPKHKGTEKLQKEIKEKIRKIKYLKEKEKKQKKAGFSYSIKKEGAGQVAIIGAENVGKSTLLSNITNAEPLVAKYPHSTSKPEIGIMDYQGVGVQIVEIPPITKDYIETENGLAFLSIAKIADLVILLYKDEKDKKFVLKEIHEGELQNRIILVQRDTHIDKIKQIIWDNLFLIYAYTKQPNKDKPDMPPVALPIGATVRDLALKVHKDFVKKFKFARVTGPSAKFPEQRVGLEHELKEGDIVELHAK